MNLADDPQQKNFADDMTEELIGELSRIGSLRVISRTSVMQYKGGVPTENSVRINPHPCGALVADLVDALSLLASTAESKDWQSLPRRVVECIQVQGVRVAKESGVDQQKFGRVDQGEAAFPLRKANVEVTGLLRLSGASLVSVV